MDAWLEISLAQKQVFRNLLGRISIQCITHFLKCIREIEYITHLSALGICTAPVKRSQKQRQFIVTMINASPILPVRFIDVWRKIIDKY